MNNSIELSDSQLEELFEKPDLFLWQFDDSQALFVKMDRNAYHNTIFCDQRILAPSNEIVRIDFSRLYDFFCGRPPQETKLHYIFHIAHCGSTLLARAADIKDKNIVYREPSVLRQLGAEAASAFYGAAPPAAWQQKLELSLALLNRRYTKDAPVIIKGNVPVNFMIPALLERSTDSPAILLYLSLENYLLAVLKSPNHRSWVATIFAELSSAVEVVMGFTVEQRDRLSIPEAAGCLWMVQMAIFSQILQAYSNVRTLDAEIFYGEPENTLHQCFEFFQQSIDGSTISDIVKSDLFTRYSKDPRQAYDNNTRLAQREAIRDQLAGDIDKAREWVNQHTGQVALPLKLGKPLSNTVSLLLD